MNKEQATALVNEAKKKATAFWTMFKEKVVALWKSGRKGKAICIGGALVVLLLLTRCGGSGGGGSADTGRGGEFTGKIFSNVFVGNPTQDEGVIYKHTPNTSIKVLQASKKGNLVGYVQGANPFASGYESAFGAMGVSFDRMVWLETPGRVYEDDETLGAGFYIRRGSHEYTGIDGGTHTVARYIEVTDEATLKKIQKQIDDEKAAEAKAKLEAEGKPIELDAPVKSLCGFAMGTTPSSVANLFNKEKASWNSDRTSMQGELATPFRHFGEAELSFKTNFPAGGKHLWRMELKPVGGHSPLATEQENYEEIKTIVAMLEKKFGIKFEFSKSEFSSSVTAEWKSDGGDECIKQSIEISYYQGFLYLIFQSDLITEKEKTALEAQQKPAKLSSDAGADLL